ncbi:uncharacterized protein K02A2.6-like [Anastrepha obliqua]|uniref:uncharacterized protein K02A2.6-like n=1 Tax=Anastrepha obliqua TaxID=95512 RepID=UPI00240A0D75|nr:uncharacterized protein K02A2.6-like [Anastrepha obliqua]
MDRNGKQIKSSGDSHSSTDSSTFTVKTERVILQEVKRVNMAGVGNLEPFDLNQPNKWSTYMARFGLFLLANDVQEEGRQKAAFLTLAGAPLYDLLTSLASPKQVSNLNLPDIKTILTNHFSPRPSEIAAYYHFHKRDQYTDESVSNYIAALRTLAVDCNFGTALDRMLRDRFVCGMKDEGLQKSLLAEKDLTVQKVIERALSNEAAAISAMAMRHPSEPVNVVNDNRFRTRTKNAVNRNQQLSCNGCGGSHPRKQCPYRESLCNACGVKGHLQRACRSASNVNSHRASSSNSTNARSGSMRKKSSRRENVNQITPLVNQKKSISVTINGRTCIFEVDSGSPVTIMTESTFNSVWSNRRPNLSKCDVDLSDYQRNHIPVKGIIDVSIYYNRRKIDNLPLIIANSGGSNLVGCNWFDALGMRIEGVFAVNSGLSIKAILKKYDHLFSTDLGRYTGPPVSLQIDSAVPPVRLPPRRIPFAIKGPVEEEIDRLCCQGILEPVDYSDWATPIVPVVKKDGSIRICGDYKSTLNKAIKPHCHQIPAVSTLLASIEGGSIYAKIDLAQAYQQLVVDERSSLLQTVSTHKGAFKVTRLQFGISSAPGIFQSCIENVLQNIPGVLPYFDDIVVMGKSEDELANRLEQIFVRFDKAGLRLRKDKCQFSVPSIEFLGFKLDNLGIRPSHDKIKAIHEAPSPKDKKQLQAFLGLLNFYHAFLPNKATIAEPLHRLLDKSARWSWKEQHETAFNTLKRLIASENVLIHYNENLPLVLTCDASPYGLGAVLSHRLADGSEKPIAFYSRTLSKAERNYAQIDREAVALVSGVKKFHNYLYGRFFTLVTDHRPLLGIFTTSKPVPNVISNTMLRRSIFLSAYNFNLVHRAGLRMGNADFLSRCPMLSEAESTTTEDILMVEISAKPVVSAQLIASQTSKDPELSKVFNWVLRGWPSKINRSDKLYQYFCRRTELSANRGCLVWGNRAVIPSTLRGSILKTLHAPHPGIVKMKAVARSYVWWPNIDAEIELVVKRCSSCQQNRNDQPQTTTHHWESAKRPWSRLHVDFAGPFRGKLFFILIDSYSKWLEVAVVNSTSSAAAIKVLRQIFATHGLPDELVSDNGTAFTSEEFKNFMKNNLIRHIRSAPFHPSTNGQAERMVQSTKNYLKKAEPGINIDLSLARYLFNQHTTPHSTTNRSPAELLFNRELKTYFDKIQPHEIVYGKVTDPVSTKPFISGSPVWVRNHSTGPRWIEGLVENQTGPISYEVRLNDSRVIKRHQDQLRSRVASEDSDCEILSTEDVEASTIQSSEEVDSSTSGHVVETQSPGPSTNLQPVASSSPTPEEPRRSKRDRQAPQFYSASGC